MPLGEFKDLAIGTAPAKLGWAYRIQYTNALYHVMNRGNDRQSICRGSEDFKIFVGTLEELSLRFGVQIFAYCLMTNHYHLVIRTPEANLSRAMRHFGHCYTQRFNGLYARDGHLFRGRYRALLIEDENYFLQAVRYVHRNPIEAGMVRAALEYPYSSHAHYMRGSAPSWLYANEVLEKFSTETSQALGRFAEFVNNGNSKELMNFYDRLRLPSTLSSEAVIQHFDSIGA